MTDEQDNRVTNMVCVYCKQMNGRPHHKRCPTRFSDEINPGPGYMAGFEDAVAIYSDALYAEISGRAEPRYHELPAHLYPKAP